jgi:glucose 1-dehydrogenase
VPDHDFRLHPPDARLLEGRRALVTGATSGIYCASKGAMKLFAQSIAKELAPHGIRVVSVAPGAIATPINEEVLDDPKDRREVEAEIPLGRWGEVSDVARAVAWVASEQAQYVVGATLFVDGGMTLYPGFG